MGIQMGINDDFHGNGLFILNMIYIDLLFQQ